MSVIKNKRVSGGDGLRVTTWANRGNAADYAGDQVFFSDLGMTGYSDGVNWQVKRYPQRSVIKVATFGDSTSNFGDSQSPANNDTTVATMPMPASGVTQVTRYLERAILQCLYPSIRFVTNCGISGRTVATMVTDEQASSTISTRKVIDTENNAPDIVFYRGGSINDFDQASYPISDNAYNIIVANCKTIINRLLASTNAYIVIEGIFGWSKGLAGYPVDVNGDATRVALMRFNVDIKNYVDALNSPRIEYLDSLGINCDATGAFLPGHSPLSDGIHNSLLGGYVRGQAEKSIIERIFGKSAKYTHVGKNVQTNPLFASQTSNIPTNYSWASPTNGTRQNYKIEAINGEIWATAELLVTATAPAGLQVPLPYNPLSTGTNPLNVAINDVYGIEIDFSVENVTSGLLSGISTCYMRATTYDVTNAKREIVDIAPLFTNDTGVTIPGKLNLHFALPPIKFQEDAASYGTSSGLIIVFTCNATAGDVLKFGISNPRIVKNPA